jgi:hypothetical protein
MGLLMARINASYGSELHLLRMLGRHRKFFDKRVCDEVGAEGIEWCDFPSGNKREDENGHVSWDREWQHLEFLPHCRSAKKVWDAAWPTHRPGHNWDAIGRVECGGLQEWLLVEAKANIEELTSDCHAKDQSSRDLIQSTLDKTKLSLGAVDAGDWTKRYYQFCNRLAALHIMNRSGSPARMLFVYFCGDVNPSKTCPATPSGWAPALSDLEKYVGLPADRFYLRDRLHKMFIHVQCVGLND